MNNKCDIKYTSYMIDEKEKLAQSRPYGYRWRGWGQPREHNPHPTAASLLETVRKECFKTAWLMNQNQIILV